MVLLPCVSLSLSLFPSSRHSYLSTVVCWQVNVDAAEAAVASQLLSPDGAPFCYTCGADDAECLDGTPRVLRCSETAARTNRAGAYELEELARLDRPYCDSDVFKRLQLDNASVSEGACRDALRERVDNCRNGVCRRCVNPCVYPSAATVANLFRCADGTRHSGFVHYYHTSDAGQLARSMHGAVRKTGFQAVPEKLTSHLYHIAHFNPSGLLQRDAVSCRTPTQNSPSARFVAGFDEDGSPVGRTGYMVPCRTNTDCLACGRHPLTGNVRAHPHTPTPSTHTRAHARAHLCSSTNARLVTRSTTRCAPATAARSSSST